MPKAGRKPQHYISSDGTPILGLARDKKSGRWRIIASKKFFTEENETLAIQKFKRLTGSQSRAKYAASTLPELLEQLPMILASAESWPIVADVIRQKPLWCARSSGIEALGYLESLTPPPPSLTVSAISETFKLRGNGGQQQTDAASWEKFVKSTGIETIAEITPATVVKYRDEIFGNGWGGAMQNQNFGGIKRVLKFVKSRAISMEEISKRLITLELLKPNKSRSNVDPKPISVEDWQQLLRTSTGDDKAMILLMLNCAMYMAEAVRIKWAEVDKNGGLVGHRHKKGQVVRVAILWPETIEALADVKRRGEHVFFGEQGIPLGISGATKRFDDLRKAAGLPNVTGSMLRDGAITAAAECGFEEKVCKLLEGHRTSGESDKYLKRSPMIVANLCQAIRAKYFTKLSE